VFMVLSGPDVAALRYSSWMPRPSCTHSLSCDGMPSFQYRVAFWVVNVPAQSTLFSSGNV
jgi:hypothetical protein